MVKRIVPTEPGESEFSWGRGLMAPEERGYVPTPQDQLLALHRFDQDPHNVTATDSPNYDEVTRETGPAGQNTNQAGAG